MAALFVAEEWDRVGNPMAALNCQLAIRSAEDGIKTHCMVLRVHDEKERDRHIKKVNIMTPCFDEDAKGEVKDKEPDCDWLLSPETYFIQVSQALNVQTIVGHFPVSSAAAIVLRKRFFQNAKVILINHGIPASLNENYLNAVAKADVVFSVGRKVFKHLSDKYLPEKAHKLLLPRPDKAFFDLNIKKPSSIKQVLTTTVGSRIDCKFNKMLAKAIGKVAKLFHEMEVEQLSWYVQTNIPLNCESIKEKLIHYSECEYITPKINPPYGCQDECCTELCQSYLCIIPPDESNGMQGLESIAAGLPVLAPKESSVGDLITELCPLSGASLMYEKTCTEDLYDKIRKALLDKNVVARIAEAKELKQKYQNSDIISRTHEQFSHFMKPPAGTTGPESPKSDEGICVSPGRSPEHLSPHTETDKESNVSTASDDKATTPLQPILTAGKHMRNRKRKHTVPAELRLEIRAKEIKLKEQGLELQSKEFELQRKKEEWQLQRRREEIEVEREKMNLEKEKMRFEQEKKLHELIEEKQKCIASGADTITIQRLKEAIEDCRANIEIIQSRSLLLILSYLSEEDMDYFLERYKSGEVEKILTEILISSEIQALAEEAGFTVRCVLKIDEAEFNEVKQIMKDMNVLPALDNTWHRSPVYENWERYVLDHVPNIHHARYLIEQLRFDPVFNTLRQEEFFYPAFVSYWHQEENLYSLPPTVTKATQYAIMYQFQINCKEHDLDKDRAWSALQERFQEIGKVLYDNISDESIGKLSTSWFDSGIIGTELQGLVENCGDYYCFNSLFVYAYIIACYVCADIKSGGKCLDQLMEDKMFNFLQKMLPYLYFYIPGILRDDAEIALLKEYTQRLLMMNDDVNVCLERLGYCLLESNCASELVNDVKDMVGQQILDLSNCTSVSNQSLHAFAAVIQNTSVIQEVVIHSEKEISTFSSEFKECIDKFSSEAKTTKELSVVIKDQHEFISFVKLLRALPILKCFHNKSESAHCYIPDMQSVKVTATSRIDHVNQGFVEMLVQALEWMPLLERFDLVKIGPVSSNILKCMANVKPNLNIAMFGLAENELSFDDCEMIVTATSSMPNLRHLDLKNNNIGSVGCAALLPIKDYMEVIIDGNGVGEGLSDILEVVCDQDDVPGISSEEIKTLADFHQLQRFLDTVTKLDTSNVPHSRFEKFCDSLSLFTKTKYLKYHYNKSMTLNELELLIASLHHLKNMTHFDINEIQVDTEFLEDSFISDDSSLPGKTLTIPFINKIFLSIQPSLTNLSICRSNICKAFRGESIKHLTNLVKLDLSHNKLSGSDLRNINIPDSIMSVNISHNSIESINDVSFKHCQKLADINMSHNDMHSPLKDILQTLPPTIQYCDFSNNNITDVSDVGKLLDNFQNIKHLNLGSNRFGAFGVNTLRHDITKYDMQSKVDVSHNFSCLYRHVRDQLANMLELPDVENGNMMLNNKHLMFIFEIISRITRLHIKVPAMFSKVEKQVLSYDLRLLQVLKSLDVIEIADDDLDGILASLNSLENLVEADFRKTGISIRGICKLFEFQHLHKTKPYINVAHNLINLSDIMPYIKDQLKSYSEDVDLDSEQLPVDQLKFCKELCEITDINLSYRYLGNPQGGKLCSGLKNLPRLRHVDLSFNDIGNYGAFVLSREMERGSFNLMYLDFSHNKISDRGLKILSQGLQQISDLEQLDLSYNNITDRGAGYLGQAEVWMQNVTYLDLSHNEIGDSGTQSLTKGMGTTSKLEHLNLGHNKIGDRGAVSLSEGLRRMLPCVLTFLDLSHNGINGSGKESLMIAMHSMNHLDLSHNPISNFGLESFNIEDMTWEELRHLDLSKNNIDDLGAASLSYGIEKMIKLQHLNLSSNCIGDDGAESLSVGMEQIGELTHINLSHNQIGPTGAGHLGKGIATMHKLIDLDLSNNEIIDSGTKVFSESFTGDREMIIWYSLSCLNLSNNGIGDSGAKSLREAVKTMNQLTQLDLSYNNIGYKGAKCLCEMIGRLTNLTHLSLGHNKIGVSDAFILNRQIKLSKRSIHLYLGHNDVPV